MVVVQKRVKFDVGLFVRRNNGNNFAINHNVYTVGVAKRNGFAGAVVGHNIFTAGLQYFANP